MDKQDVRLIDANSLEDELNRWLDENPVLYDYGDDGFDYGKISGVDFCIEKLQKAPTIDPDSMRPRGKWIKGPKREDGLYHIMCSKCKTDAHFSYFYEEDYDGELSGYAELLEYPSEYCPNCGAKMEDRNHD